MRAANQAWYWLAAGVLALGLNGYYQDGGLQGVHRLADSTLAKVSTTKAQFTEMAMLARVAMADHSRFRCERRAPTAVVAFDSNVALHPPSQLPDFQVRLGDMQSARVQARVAGLEQVIRNRQLQRAQVALRNRGLEVLTDQGQVQVELPQVPQVQITVPQSPAVDMSEPN
jgi:hypothetical protein